MMGLRYTTDVISMGAVGMIQLVVLQSSFHSSLSRPLINAATDPLVDIPSFHLLIHSSIRQSIHQSNIIIQAINQSTNQLISQSLQLATSRATHFNFCSL